jgi:hypothetical protein
MRIAAIAPEEGGIQLYRREDRRQDEGFEVRFPVQITGRYGFSDRNLP